MNTIKGKNFHRRATASHRHLWFSYAPECNLSTDDEQASTISTHHNELGTVTCSLEADSDGNINEVPTTIIYNSKIPTDRTVSIVGENIDKNVNQDTCD